MAGDIYRFRKEREREREWEGAKNTGGARIRPVNNPDGS